jgi:beta-ribofuranosylaminobenzene 5'-phosphate synthase
MPHVVHVAAPSRLHFGLWSLAGADREFGGVGAMIDRPGLKLSVAPKEKFAATGPLAERVRMFACRWAEFHRAALPACEVRVADAPPQHVGLGTGTQLGLAVASGLNAWAGYPPLSAIELAVCTGRAQRSAVGTYGFLHGGLIVEQGKLPGEPISPLDCRVDLPADWRFVLVRPTELSGLAGDDEAQAIDSLPAVPTSVHDRLVAEAREHLVPAAATADYADFAGSLYRYGKLAGQCFAARQGGPYNGPVLAALVQHIREIGYEGVGQSSWGPTLFVLTENQPAAENLATGLRAESSFGKLAIDLACPCNTGASIALSDE